MRRTMVPNETEAVDPVKLRSVFGANLRKLADRYPSVAGLCRELGINRTQFNRYLSAESFPRPDVLHRICTFFDVDARILLEPVEGLKPEAQDIFHHPVVEEFLGKTGSTVTETDFPSGLYRFSRPSFIDEDQFVIGLLYVFRRDGQTFLRSLEAKQAMQQQGMAGSTRNREIRGIILKQEQGIALLAARRNSTTCSFSFLSRVASFQNNFWEGYAARTIAESITGQRVVRMVCEHVSGNTNAIFSAARQAGLCTKDDLPAYHARLLRIGQKFQ